MSNKLTFLLTLILTIAACTHKKKKSVEDNVHPSDTTCIKEITQAKTDLKNNKLVYCNYVGNIVWQALRAENEMQGLLKQNGIEYQDESSPCVIQESRNYHCYCEFMQEKINEKFGNKYTDSLLYIADSLWIMKNRDRVFDCGSERSCWDKPAIFPGDSTYDQTNHSGLQLTFEKNFIYPKDYYFSDSIDLPIMLQVYLFIDEKGNAKINDFQMCAWAKANEKHYSYFKTEAKKIIEQTKWEPATIKSIGVKSKNDIFIYIK